MLAWRSDLPQAEPKGSHGRAGHFWSANGLCQQALGGIAGSRYRATRLFYELRWTFVALELEPLLSGRHPNCG